MKKIKNKILLFIKNIVALYDKAKIWIDTICLLIPKHKMTFKDITNWELYSKNRTIFKFVRNPKKLKRILVNISLD